MSHSTNHTHDEDRRESGMSKVVRFLGLLVLLVLVAAMAYFIGAKRGNFFLTNSLGGDRTAAASENTAPAENATTPEAAPTPETFWMVVDSIGANGSYSRKPTDVRPANVQECVTESGRALKGEVVTAIYYDCPPTSEQLAAFNGAIARMSATATPTATRRAATPTTAPASAASPLATPLPSATATMAPSATPLVIETVPDGQFVTKEELTVALVNAIATARAEEVAAPQPAAPASNPVVGTTGNSIEELVNSPYMLAYQGSLPYTNPAPAKGIPGFLPVPSLNAGPFDLPNGYEVRVPAAPADVTNYDCFPQDYSEGDQFNRGCGERQANGTLPWTTPIAGFNDSNNWSCEDVTGWCPDSLSSFNWEINTGYVLCHPAVGCVQDPDGGAALIGIVNFHDSDEVWNVRNGSAMYGDDAWQGYGTMFDLSGGSYNVGEGIAAVRNHFIHELSNPVGGDNRYEGQCGDSGLCETVTYVMVARVWDRSEVGIPFSHFELLGAGQWTRP